MVSETPPTKLYLGLDIVDAVKDPPQLSCILALTLLMVSKTPQLSYILTLMLSMMSETPPTEVYLGLDVVNGVKDPLDWECTLTLFRSYTDHVIWRGSDDPLPNVPCQFGNT